MDIVSGVGRFGRGVKKTSGAVREEIRTAQNGSGWILFEMEWNGYYSK